MCPYARSESGILTIPLHSAVKIDRRTSRVLTKGPLTICHNKHSENHDRPSSILQPEGMATATPSSMS